MSLWKAGQRKLASTKTAFRSCQTLPPVEAICRCLAKTRPDLCYPDWVKALAVLKNYSASLNCTDMMYTIARDWSAGLTKDEQEVFEEYPSFDLDEFDTKWDTLEALSDKPPTIASLTHLQKLYPRKKVDIKAVSAYAKHLLCAHLDRELVKVVGVKKDQTRYYTATGDEYSLNQLKEVYLADNPLNITGDAGRGGWHPPQDHIYTQSECYIENRLPDEKFHIIYKKGKPVLNTFSGWPVTKTEYDEADIGDADPIYQHILSNLCGNHAKAYEYLCGWLAHSVQMPEEQAGTCPVFLSVAGTGKSLIFNKLLGEIFGRFHSIYNHADLLLGEHNSVEHDLFAICDEMVVSRAQHGKLINWITEGKATVNPKFMPKKTITVQARFIITCNREIAVKPFSSDRRFLFFKCSNKRMPHSAGRRLYKLVCDRKIQVAFFKSLRERDLSGFSIHDVPYSLKKRASDYISMNVGPIEEALLCVLSENLMSDGEEFNINTLSNRVAGADVICPHNHSTKIQLAKLCDTAGLQKCRVNNIRYQVFNKEILLRHFQNQGIDPYSITDDPIADKLVQEAELEHVLDGIL
jgi:hypothetical protein